ncbi:MAG: HIT family protein [Coprobacillus sp.]
MNCLFCERKSYVIDNEYGYVIYDENPVSLGHMLIIPKRHVQDFFEADEKLKIELIKLLDQAKEILNNKYHPEGYNIGMNCGEVAGQSIMHLHIHLIPRYKGDTENPKGGIRGVIPEKMNY